MNRISMFLARAALPIGIGETAAISAAASPPAALDGAAAVSERVLWRFAGAPDDGDGPGAALITDKWAIFTARPREAARIRVVRVVSRRTAALRQFAGGQTELKHRAAARSELGTRIRSAEEGGPIEIAHLSPVRPAKGSARPGITIRRCEH